MTTNIDTYQNVQNKPQYSSSHGATALRKMFFRACGPPHATPPDPAPVQGRTFLPTPRGRMGVPPPPLLPRLTEERGERAAGRNREKKRMGTRRSLCYRSRDPHCERPIKVPRDTKRLRRKPRQKPLCPRAFPFFFERVKGGSLAVAWANPPQDE